MRWFLPLLAMVFLGGCGHTPVGSDIGALSRQAKVVSDFDRWQIEGRIALRQGQKSWVGTVRWRQWPDQSELRLHGPLGRGGFLLKQQAELATLYLDDGEIYRADSVDELVARHFDWPVPLSSLRFWAVGRPAKGRAEESQFDDQGRLRQFRQDGWLIRYSRYGSGAGPCLPGTVELERGNRSVRLVIRHWTVLPDET
ncbi:MAG: lipoprotein insertase outer membrane protein LolB [Gammaproteobacteria bacterium]|nr:lipoprotein insertase outer membrane protein LolB [Gammaproteobacteria bacterium]